MSILQPLVGGMMVHKTPLGLAFFIVGFIAIGHMVWAQPFTAVKNLEVIDAQGQKVGDVIDIVDQLPIVVYRFNDQFFTISVTDNALGGNSILLYGSNDCSGPPLLLDNSAQFLGLVTPLIPSFAIAPPGRTVYLPKAGASSQMIALSSWQAEVGDCQVFPEQQTGPAFEAQPMLNLDNFLHRLSACRKPQECRNHLLS
jgi:hypothetical protein